MEPGVLISISPPVCVHVEMFAYVILHPLCPPFPSHTCGVVSSRPRYACVAQHRPLLPNEGEAHLNEA